jgi:hypothetical protein
LALLAHRLRRLVNLDRADRSIRVAHTTGLISIGFAAETGEHLYIELVEGWDRSKCNDFVVSTVLPLLGRCDPLRLTREAAACVINDWINALRRHDRSAAIIFLSDSLWDWDHLKNLFPWTPGSEPWVRAERVFGRLISSELGTPGRTRLFEQLVMEWARDEPEVHHALVDAMALRDIFGRVLGAYEPASGGG